MSSCQKMLSAAVLVAFVSTSALGAANVTYNDPQSSGNAGQVNISGATLFKSFFQSKSSTNDAIDADMDGLYGFDPNNPLFVDQLAPDFTCSLSTFWLVQYRGTGSGNGLAEFVDFQLLGELPDTYTADPSLINRTEYASGGVAVGTGCGVDTPQGLLTGTPVNQESVDLAVMDVPTTWFVVAGDSADADPFNNPTDSGYGYCPIPDNYGKVWSLKSLKRTIPDPNDPNSTIDVSLNTIPGDPMSVVDYPIAWVPIAFIANRGTGVSQLKVSELQTLYLSGRLPNGENFNAGTRDAGSGTRNGGMNSIGIDPSWGKGDGLHRKWEDKPSGYLGDHDLDPAISGDTPEHKWTNSNSSSRMEDAVTNNRLCIAYTGLMDDSKAADHFMKGDLEIIDVMFDDRGGTQYVRPSIQNVVENGDPNTGYQIGGPETFAARMPAYTSPSAQAYIDNITGSIASFTGNLGAVEELFMPGDYLGTQFILQAAPDYIPNPTNPSQFIANSGQNATLKAYTLTNAILTPNYAGLQSLPAYGSRNVAGKTPRRNAKAGGGTYSDGSSNGDYIDAWGNSWVRGTLLTSNNAIAGDFNLDGVRDINDITKMVEAYNGQIAYAQANSTSANPVIPSIIGDFDGNGEFDMFDCRYFCDGLAISGGQLDRAAAFLAIDTAFGGNFFGTVIAGGLTYEPGFSRFDVAGATTIPTPGAGPCGADGIVDQYDVDYVAANFGTWPTDWMTMDLSGDMTGDLVVDNDDLDAILAALGQGGLLGDANCDGSADVFDIDAFVLAITDGAAWQTTYDCSFDNCDCNEDDTVDVFDIDTFVQIITGH
ncbi:MAG: hypothetical protein JXO22_09895 [Phycisphaerae bacterium]|nr:hypothetical protein [Phycisphaerae bacterium]